MTVNIYDWLPVLIFCEESSLMIKIVMKNTEVESMTTSNVSKMEPVAIPRELYRTMKEATMDSKVLIRRVLRISFREDLL